MNKKHMINVTIIDNEIQVKFANLFLLALKDTPFNRKILMPILRNIEIMGGKEALTYQQISLMFGYDDRRRAYGFCKRFKNNEGDFQTYLNGNGHLIDDAIPLVEKQILKNPLLPVSLHYKEFLKKYREFSITESQFRIWVSRIDSNKLLQRLQKLLKEKKVEINEKKYLKELLNLSQIDKITKKEIISNFEEDFKEISNSFSIKTLNISNDNVSILLSFLYGSGVSQNLLKNLFNLSKTSIHNKIRDFCNINLEREIFSRLKYWSGKIGIDEKYIELNGVWHYILSAVDIETGFPLLMKVYNNLDSLSYGIFLKEFKHIYGIPKLILSDGFSGILNALKLVFPKVSHQLCKFHKLKNLMKKIREKIFDFKEQKLCLKLAKRIFSNKSVSSRKYAAKTLKKVKELSKYVENHILKCWKKLTKNLTNNVSERNNRKLKKSISNRYGGIRTIKSAEVLVRSFWLKELLINGKKHFDKFDELNTINLPKMMFKNVTLKKTLQFSSIYTSKNTDKAA